MLHSDPLALDFDLADRKRQQAAKRLAQKKRLLIELQHFGLLRRKLVKAKQSGKLSWPDYQRKDKRLAKLVANLKARLGLQN